MLLSLSKRMLGRAHVGHLDYGLYEKLQRYIHGDYARQRAILRREFARHAVATPDGTACRILELACGGGSLAGTFPPATYVGIDSSVARIAAARRAHPGHRFESCDIAHSACEAHLARADFVFCHGLLHHLADDACRGLLARIRALSRKPATLVMIEPLLPKPWWNLPGFLIGKMDEGHFMRDGAGYRAFLEGDGPRSETFSLFPRLPLRMQATVVRFP